MRKEETRKIAFASLMLAIIIIMTFVPSLGYIILNPVNTITLIHIPVLIGAVFLGKNYGAFLGLVFGIGSMIMAYINISTNAPFTNPLISVVPRVVFGYIIGYVFELFKKLFNNKKIYVPISFGVATFLHSLIVLVGLYFITISGFYYRASQYPFSNIAEIITSILSINSLLEIGIAIVVCTPIYFALKQLESRSQE